MTRKISPQQIRVQEEKKLAKKSKIEDLLMDVETHTRIIEKYRTLWDEVDIAYRNKIKYQEDKRRTSQRLVKYKREQIVSRIK